MIRISHIIKARATTTQRPDYFAAETELQAKETKAMLEASDWQIIETREIVKRDAHTEGILKRCSLGSERERANLQALFNLQTA